MRKLVLVMVIAAAAWFGWRQWGRGEGAKKPAAAEGPRGEPASYEVLFPRGKVRLPGPLATIPLDGSVDDMRRAAPAAFADRSYEVHDARWPDDSFVLDVTVDQQDRPIDVDGFSVYLRSGDPAEVLTAAWGPGLAGEDEWGNPALYWFNPDDGIRAQLSDGRLELRHYIPTARLLGPGKELAFVTSPIIGQTPEAVAKAYGDRAEMKFDLVSLRMPRTEWELQWPHTMNGIATLDGAIVAYNLMIPYAAYPPAREELLALFRSKWGREETVPDGLRFVSGPVELIVRDTGYSFDLAQIDRAAMEGLR